MKSIRGIIYFSRISREITLSHMNFIIHKVKFLDYTETLKYVKLLKQRISEAKSLIIDTFINNSCEGNNLNKTNLKDYTV